MKKYAFLVLCLLASSCNSHENPRMKCKGKRDREMYEEGREYQMGAIAISNTTALSSDNMERLKRFYPITLGKIEKNQPLNMQDIKNLTRAGVSDSSIITLISDTKSVFYLTPKDYQSLIHAGVSKKVIEQMRSTSDTHY